MPTKIENLVKKATALGVQLTGKEKITELEILIEDAENKNKQPSDVEEKREEDDLEPVDIVLVKDADAPLIGARYIRQYSQEVHGDDFKALAAEFCQKKLRVGIYKAVKASLIGYVEVLYREKLDADKHLDKQDPNAPIVDKTKRYGVDDKVEAVRFGTQKSDSTVIVARPKKNK